MAEEDKDTFDWGSPCSWPGISSACDYIWGEDEPATPSAGNGGTNPPDPDDPASTDPETDDPGVLCYLTGLDYFCKPEAGKNASASNCYPYDFPCQMGEAIKEGAPYVLAGVSALVAGQVVVYGTATVLLFTYRKDVSRFLGKLF